MSDFNNTNDMAMDWDDAVENDGQEFVLLPEGDYNYTVTAFERGRYPGGAKLPACPKASLTLRVNTDKGIALVHTDLFLCRSVEWRISAFFRSIGLKKHGERLVMDWNKVIGTRGRAHFKPRSYTKDGEERQTNDVDRFYDYDDKYFEGESDENGFMTIPDDAADDLPFI